MRSSSRRGSGRHAQPAPAATVPGPARISRPAVRGAVLVALVAGAGALAACAGSAGGDGAELRQAALLAPAAPEAAAAADARAVASRADVRAPVARTVAVTVGGATTQVSTAAQTVADVLDEAGVTVGADDLVEPSLTDPATDAVTIQRVTFLDGVDRQPIPFERTEIKDAALESGVRKVETAGVAGVQTVAFRVRLVDGLEVSREEVLRTVVAPVAEVVRVGTKVTPPPAPARVATAPRRAATAPAAAASSVAASGPVVAGDPRTIGRTLAEARGWGGDQFACLDRLWTRESNWNPSAQNRSSGAYGIPQALPGSKMGTVAADWRTNPATQITWGLNYIGGRYGSPCGAWAHSQARGWY